MGALLASNSWALVASVRRLPVTPSTTHWQPAVGRPRREHEARATWIRISLLRSVGRRAPGAMRVRSIAAGGMSRTRGSV